MGANKSGTKIFFEAGYLKCYATDRSNVLSFDECELFYDIKNKSFDPEMGDAIVRQAETYMQTEIPQLTLTSFMDLSRTGVRSRYESGYYTRRRMLLYLSMAEAYENKGRFIDKAADVLWAIMDECCWTAPAHMGRHPYFPGNIAVPFPYREDQPVALELYSAQTCAVLSLAAYYIRDKLDEMSPYICERLDHLVYLRGIKPYIEISYKWTGEHIESAVNNWVTNITSCILLATAVTCRDFTIRKRVMEIAMYRLDFYTAAQSADGLCDEGPGYWGGAGGNLFDCLELLEDMSGGKINVYSNPLIKKLGEYIATVNISGDYYLNFADARPKCRYDGKMIMRYGRKCGSEELVSFGRALDVAYSPDTPIYQTMCYRNMKNFFTERVKECDKVKAKIAYWYEDNKVAIFRESNDPSQGFFLGTKGGSNKEIHNHNDVGCLVVYHNGKPVIVDPSHGSYNHGFFGPTRYYRWFMKSSYHSIPLPNGVEQKEGAEFVSQDEKCDLENKTVTMNLANAFPKEAGLEKMIRTCKLDGSTVCVTDTVELKEEGEIRFNYLTLDEPKLIENGKLEISEGRVFSYEADANLELIIEKVENTYLPYDDLDFKNSWQRDCLWRIVLRAIGKECRVKIEIV